MFTPDETALGAELRHLAHLLYVDGTIGPSMTQYNLHRPDSWPAAGQLLRHRSYPTHTLGWRRLLAFYGLHSPTRHQSRAANRRLFGKRIDREVMDEARLRRIAAYDEDALHGDWVERDCWEVRGGRRVLVRHKEFRLR